MAARPATPPSAPPVAKDSDIKNENDSQLDDKIDKEETSRESCKSDDKDAKNDSDENGISSVKSENVEIESENKEIEETVKMNKEVENGSMDEPQKDTLNLAMDKHKIIENDKFSRSSNNGSSKENNGELGRESPPSAESENSERDRGTKRSNNEDSTNDQYPSKRIFQEAQDSFQKKMFQDLQETFQKHDSILTEYISNLSCENEEEINKHAENLIGEIEMLRELANAKEIEWNHLLYLRKVKEEILLRLLRKKNTLTLEKVATNISDSNKETINKQINKNCVSDENDEIGRLRQKQMALAGNGVQLNSSGLMMVPVNSAMYCQSNMNNFNFDNHMNIPPFGSKNMLHKSMMVPPGHRMPPDFAPPDMNMQCSKFSQQMGRQGPTKDVQSIIADYRQKHPEEVPRRRRRMKSMINPQIPIAPRGPVPHSESNMPDMGLLLGGVDSNPHLPSIDAVSLQQNPMLSQPGVFPNGMSFKDVLVQFANMTGNQQSACMVARLPPPPPYPEVTLHPVNASASSNNQAFSAKLTQQQQQQQNSSMLHGILTKSQPRQDNRFSSFSPTLARLLTAPEKNLPANNPCRVGSTSNPTNNFIPQKPCSEITITAVQPQANNQQNRQQQEPVPMDEFEEAEIEEDSADRPLVIDESGRGDSNSGTKEAGGSLELTENEVPECQGCHRREAQFVCAGCANQWYCSRECQVSAWDEHSEVCSG